MYKFYLGYFYPYDLKQDYMSSGTWPRGGVDVTDEVFLGFSNYKPGKKVGVGSSGEPIWIDDNFAVSDFADAATLMRKSLIDKASNIIAPLQDAVDIDDATSEEIELLKKWKKYRVELSRVDLSNAPDVDWPTQP